MRSLVSPSWYEMRRYNGKILRRRCERSVIKQEQVVPETVNKSNENCTASDIHASHSRQVDRIPL